MICHKKYIVSTMISIGSILPKGAYIHVRKNLYTEFYAVSRFVRIVISI